MKFPTPDYRGLKTAPGLFVVVSDFRLVRAFPVLRDENSLLIDSDVNRMYVENAERSLLQSVAVSTMSAHLVAAALGYYVWWVTAIGQQAAQRELKPFLGVTVELSVLDIMCFGPPKKGPYKRWKKELHEIVNWDTFKAEHYMSLEQIEDWVQNVRQRVMYRNAKNID